MQDLHKYVENGGVILYLCTEKAYAERRSSFLAKYGVQLFAISDKERITEYIPVTGSSRLCEHVFQLPWVPSVKFVGAVPLVFGEERFDKVFLAGKEIGKGAIYIVPSKSIFKTVNMGAGTSSRNANMRQQQVRRFQENIVGEIINRGQVAPPVAEVNRNVRRPDDTMVCDVQIGGSPVLGKDDAPVTITAFMDFQCPFSVREYPKLNQVLAEYPDDALLVFKHRPSSFHTKAPPAHAAAQLALQDGGPEAFWKMHDLIMENPSKLDIGTLRGYAETLKLDLDVFDRTLVDKAAIDKLLEIDLAEAKRCNVNATPTIVINGLKLADRSLESYRLRISTLLARSGPEKEDAEAEPAEAAAQ